MLDDVSLDVAPGRIVALAGPNGAGKTTLMRVVTGRLAADDGDVAIEGRTPAEARRLGRLGVVPQDLALYPHLTVRENLAVLGRLAGVPSARLAQRVDEAIAWSGLADRAGSPVRTLSGGMKRRVNLVRDAAPAGAAAARRADGRVDAASGARLHALLRALRDRGMGLLVTTHDLDEAAALCDDVAVMAGGASSAPVRWRRRRPRLPDGGELAVTVAAGHAEAAAAVLDADGFRRTTAHGWVRPATDHLADLAVIEQRLRQAGVRSPRPACASRACAAPSRCSPIDAGGGRRGGGAMIRAVVRTLALALWRDRGALVMAFVLPVLVFVIFAAIFGGATGEQLRLRVAVTDELGSALSVRFVDALERTPSLRMVGRFADRAVVEAQVAAGTADVGLVVRREARALDDFTGDGEAPLLVVTHPARGVAGALLAGTAQRLYFSRLPDAALRGVVRLVDESIVELTDDQRAEADEQLRAMTPEPDGAEETAAEATPFDALVAQQDVAGGGAAVDQVAYYAGAVAALFVLLSAVHAASSLHDEVESGIADRLLAGPAGLAPLVDGRAGFLVLQGFAQGP